MCPSFKKRFMFSSSAAHSIPSRLHPSFVTLISCWSSFCALLNSEEAVADLRFWKERAIAVSDLPLNPLLQRGRNKIYV